MRIMMSCMQCVQALSGSDSPLAGLHAYPQYVEINDSGIYTVTCRNGHVSSTMSQKHKHETLFELATFAILDGYYREAVTSFASSLERFYEYMIEVVLNEQGCDQELIDKMWREIAKQSERQLGAFVVLYASLFKIKPCTLSQDGVKFRNDVVHKGVVPTRAKAVEFGQEVLEVIRAALRDLRSSHPNAEVQAVFRRITTRQKSISGESSQPVTTMSSPSLLDQSHQEMSLKQYLEEQEFWHAKSLIHRYLESPKCDLKNDLLVASAVAALNSKSTDFKQNL